MTTVLVIDDEEGIRSLLDTLLREKGYDVVVASSGQEGLELFRRTRPDVLVLDLHMPRMNGFTVLQAVRHLNPRQPVIIVTGVATAEAEQQVRTLGVTEFVEKAASLHGLGEAVTRVKELATNQTRMSHTVLYEGYAIQSFPKYRPESQRWQLCIVLSFLQHGTMKPREFAPEVLYSTKQEADFHGIAFGQLLIDGKLEGRSVTDMKIDRRHGIRRFHVQFPATVFDHRKHEGSGLMLDLSLGGCRLACPLTLTTRIPVELHIQLPDLERPLVINGAEVRWVRGQLMGMAFVRMKETERQRFERAIADLRIRGDNEAP